MMKRRSLTVVSLGLAWLVSLGVVFVLGMLMAFAAHLSPTESAAELGDDLQQRNLALVIEELTGRAADMAAIMSYGDSDENVAQLEEALLAIVRLKSPEEQLVASYRLVSTLPERRLLGSIRFLKELGPGPSRDRVLSKFLEAWGGVDGRSAMVFCGKLRGAERRDSTEAVIRGWSRHDPVEAWNWVMERETNARLAQRYVSIILEDQARLDRALSIELLDSLEPGEFQNRMGLLVFKQILAAERPEDALDWLGQLPQAVAGMAYGEVALAMARTNPPAALEWLGDVSIMDEPAIFDILSDWAASQPEAAVAWAWGNVEEGRLPLYMDALAEIWLSVSGPAPLADWLNAHGPGYVLDGAIEQLAMATLEVDPATALVWAQSVSDEKDRVMLELLVGRSWLERSPEEARENLSLLLTSDEARAALLGGEGP